MPQVMLNCSYLLLCSGLVLGGLFSRPGKFAISGLLLLLCTYTSAPNAPPQPSSNPRLEKLQASTQQLLDQLYAVNHIRDAQRVYGSIAEALDATAYNFTASSYAELGHSHEARQLRQHMKEGRSSMHKLAKRYRDLKNKMRDLSRIHIMVLDRTISTWDSISLLLSQDVRNHNERNSKTGQTSSSRGGSSRDSSSSFLAQLIRKRADATEQALHSMRKKLDAAAEEHHDVSSKVESMVERLLGWVGDAQDLGEQAAHSADKFRPPAEATTFLGEAIGSLGNVPFLAGCAAVAAFTSGAAVPVCVGMLGARGVGSVLSVLGQAGSDVANKLQIESESYRYLVAQMSVMHKDTIKVSGILQEEKEWFQSTEEVINQTILETQDIVLTLDSDERKMLLRMVQSDLKQLNKLKKQLDDGPGWSMGSIADGTTAKKA